MNLLRKAILDLAHVSYPLSENQFHDIKLPGWISTTNEPNGFVEVSHFIETDGTLSPAIECIKVLSSAEAVEYSKNITGNKRPRRAHRILMWCSRCEKWVFAGKFVQHSKFHKTRSEY